MGTCSVTIETGFSLVFLDLLSIKRHPSCSFVLIVSSPFLGILDLNHLCSMKLIENVLALG